MFCPLFALAGFCAHLYIEVVHVLPGAVDVHAVIVVGVSCQQRPGYQHNGAEHD